MSRPKLATLLKTGIDAVGKMATASQQSRQILSTARRTVFEPRYPHHHRRPQQDAADDLGDDAGLVQQPEGILGRESAKRPSQFRLALLTMQQLAENDDDDGLWWCWVLLLAHWPGTRKPARPGAGLHSRAAKRNTDPGTARRGPGGHIKSNTGADSMDDLPG